MRPLPLSLAANHGIPVLVSSPTGTEMIQFPEFLLIAETFRNLWFKGCMLLAKAYRSLPRPYSVLEPSHPLSGVTLLTNPL